MQVQDLQHGTVHGPSIAPTANVSTDQTGVGVDLGQGSLVGHVSFMIANQQSDVTVDVQEAPDDVDADYATTNQFVISAAEGDLGTDGVADRFHLLQFTRSDRWARVKVGHGSNTNIRVAAGLLSQLAGNGGGSSTSPAS